MEHAIVIGSAPCAEKMRDADLEEFTRIAINKSWALRDDFDIHVGLKFMEGQHEPPKDYKLKRVKRNQYNPHLKKAGGNFLCSPSVALIVGYWAIHAMPFDTITYYGCDLVFDRTKYAGRTHFYGLSDAGPLFNKHPCMKRQDLKSVRLFVWALLHRVVLINSSAQEGSLLAYPQFELSVDRKVAFEKVMSSTVIEKIIALGLNAFEFERNARTPAFDDRWGAFAKDDGAIEVLMEMLKYWEPVQELCNELNEQIIG